MKIDPRLVAASVLCFCAVSVSAHDPELLQRMVDEARTLRDLVEGAPSIFRQEITYPLDDATRLDLDFVPNEMKASRGATLGIMALDARRAAHGLMRSSLSSEGYLLATSIMSLEDVLRNLETWSQARLTGDYAFQIFGEPSREAPWGWKVEGHHLSLNVTMRGDEVSGVPFFVGANPAEVRNGPRAGLRVLPEHEDLALALLATLDEGQREKAHDPTSPTAGILARGEPTLKPSAVGLPVAALSEDQKALVREILEAYLRPLAPSLAAEQLARIDEAGVDALHFQWRGSLDPSKRYYYTIQGPTLVIEFDKVLERGEANHIHAIVRDPARDFGRDLLGEHYRKSHAN